MATCKERKEEFLQAIGEEHIDLPRLRQLASQGIPDNYRRDYWYVLLGYLPSERREWDSVLQRQRAVYAMYTAEFIVSPQDQPNEEDHPLAQSDSSAWNQYLKHHQLLEAIDLDLPRTLPSFDFFHNCRHVEPQRAASLPTPSVDLGHGVVQFSAQVSALRNILYIYGVLNAAVGYVQGMNEILAPIYYVVYNSPKDSAADLDAIEADTFFLFSIIMEHLRDNFMRSLDAVGAGIQSCIDNMVEILEICDPVLHREMTQKVPHHLYAFRWITLLFSQEFVLPDVLLLWDSLFADPNKFSFLFYVCVAVLMLQRKVLLTASPADILANLQDIRHSVSVPELVKVSCRLYKRHGHKRVHTLKDQI